MRCCSPKRPDKIYSKTETHTSRCDFHWVLTQTEIILGQFLFQLAGHEIFTSYQMNNISSITHFYSNAVRVLCLPYGLLSKQDKKWNASNNIHCWHMYYISNNAVRGQMGLFFMNSVVCCEWLRHVCMYSWHALDESSLLPSQSQRLRGFSLAHFCKSMKGMLILIDFVYFTPRDF